MGSCWSSSCKRPVFVGRDQREFWFNRWKTGDTPWQTQGIHRLLEQHQDLVLAGKQNARVFIPLCGKAHELLWFYSHAHNVIGVEYIEKSASEFFAESGLPFEETTCHVLKCKVFRTLDHRLQIFVCSIFEFNRDCAGTMDIVWDRGALVAVNDDERPRYASVIKSLLSPGFSYALCTVVYNDPSFKGFPRSVPDDEVVKLFGDFMQLTKVTQSEEEKRLHISSSIVETLWHGTG
ncbi:thiopurine S-methyltransferase [Rhipicephalus sanguineus]|uniref:thiopurine S-methyltransferase n=1 Tax=Rhipicephalus sanguineus TaxID=34632 RepID=UPI0018931E2B|nr:thiopurine S-methyltransferase [Rhipicephalus sanguineus]